MPSVLTRVGLLIVSPSMYGEKRASAEPVQLKRPKSQRKEPSGFSIEMSAPNMLWASHASLSVAIASRLAAWTLSSTSGANSPRPQGCSDDLAGVFFLRCLALVIVAHVGAQWITK